VLCLFVFTVWADPALLDPVLIEGSYEEQYNRPRNTFSVWRVDDFNIDAWAIHYAKLFRTQTSEDDQGVYVGTSKYNNWDTYLGDQPIYSWDSDNKGWSVSGTHPTIRSGSIDYEAVVNYFMTADNAVWAYDALWQIQNSTLRSIAITGGVGSSYILPWSDSTFSGTPSFTHTTAFATQDSTYFQTGADNREFLWTFSWGQSNAARTGQPPNCTLIEYTGSNWVVNDGRFIGCPNSPRAPLVFKNVQGRDIYAFTSESGAVLFLDYNPTSKNFTVINGGLMDNLSLGPGLVHAYWWVDSVDGYDSFDMITATTTTGIITVRLHWDIHYAEVLTKVQATQGAPADFTWFFPNAGRRCFVLGGAYRGYGGLQTTYSSIYGSYMEVWCWDQAHDVWDNALRIPHEAAWFHQAFIDPQDNNNWWLVTLQQHHVVNNAMKTYHFAPMDDDEIRIYIGLESSADQASDVQWRVHESRHIVIAILSIVAFSLILALLTIFLLASGGGGGGGGSGDYSKFN